MLGREVYVVPYALQKHLGRVVEEIGGRYRVEWLERPETILPRCFEWLYEWELVTDQPMRKFFRARQVSIEERSRK